MAKILFFQNHKADTTRVFSDSIDGHFIEFESSNPKYDGLVSNIYSLLKKAAGIPPLCRQIGEYLVLKGVALEKDVFGRNMSFVYIIKGNDRFSELRSNLHNDLQQAGLSASQETIDCFENTIKRIKNRKKITLVISVMLIILLMSLFFLLKSNC